MTPTPAIDFWFDFSSPYSYVASEWIEALAARHGRTVSWHAMLLGVTFQAAELRSPVSHPLKREYSQLDFARSARFENVPLTFPTKFPQPTQNAARVFWWLHDGDGATPGDPQRAAAWAHAGLRALFAGGGETDLADPQQLKALAADFGLDPAAAEAAWNDPRWKERLKSACAQAVSQGIFGAPYVVVDGEPFWGNDRKAQIERWLASGPF
jgi:2-hydroxychromene-2-carboxylate isomerase